MNKKYNSTDLSQGESPDSPSLGVSKDILNVLLNIKEDVSAIKDGSNEPAEKEDKTVTWSNLYSKIQELFSSKSTETATPKIAKELATGASHQSSGAEKQASSLASSVSSQSSTASNAASTAAKMPMKAEGGATTEKAFWVGDGTGDKKAAELVLNPTEAPVNILNKTQREQAGINDPEVFHGGKAAGAADEETIESIGNYTKDSSKNLATFADGTSNDNLENLTKILKDSNSYGVNTNQEKAGTDGFKAYADGTVGDMFKDAPKYASGAAISSDLLGPALSGGKGTDPIQAITAPLDAMATLVNIIPTLGPIISFAIDAFKDLVVGINLAVGAMNKFAEGIAYVSGPIQQAQANLSVKQIQTDIGLNDQYGERLAKIYESSGEIWLETQKTLASIANPFIDMMVPMLEEAVPIMRQITAFFKHQDEAAGRTGQVMSGILGLGGPVGWALYFIRMWNQVRQLEDNSKLDTELQLDIFRSVKENLSVGINKEATSPTVGI